MTVDAPDSILLRARHADVPITYVWITGSTVMRRKHIRLSPRL